jgi:hypothetical protein
MTRTKAQIMPSLGVTCKTCPFSKDNELGRDRLLCTHYNQVVSSTWGGNLDCLDAIELAKLKGDLPVQTMEGQEGEEDDNRGSGRLGRLLDALNNHYNDYSNHLNHEQFRLGLRHGILKAPKMQAFHADSPYYEGYDVGYNH